MLRGLRAAITVRLILGVYEGISVLFEFKKSKNKCKKKARVSLLVVHPRHQWTYWDLAGRPCVLAQVTSALDKGSVVEMCRDLVRHLHYEMRSPPMLQPEHTLRRLFLPSNGCF